jgi:hypothetical protein
MNIKGLKRLQIRTQKGPYYIDTGISIKWKRDRFTTVSPEQNQNKTKKRGGTGVLEEKREKGKMDKGITGFVKPIQRR